MTTKAKKTPAPIKLTAGARKAPRDWEWVDVGALKPHARNYKAHPDDQVAQIMASIRDNGFFKNVVVARDNTTLAGHGVVLAAIKLGHKQVPVVRLDVAPDDPRALKVIAADNEIGRLAEVNDRALTEMLRDILASTASLEGTGFTEETLAALTFVTRPASEIADIDEAAEWAGLPEYTPQGKVIKVAVNIRTEADRVRFFEALGLAVPEAKDGTYSIWYPAKEKEDRGSVRFTDDAPKVADA